jgi:hypothetical protein
MTIFRGILFFLFLEFLLLIIFSLSISFSPVITHSLGFYLRLASTKLSLLLAATFTTAPVQIPFDSCHLPSLVYAWISSKRCRHVTLPNVLLSRGDNVPSLLPALVRQSYRTCTWADVRSPHAARLLLPATTVQVSRLPLWPELQY